MPEREGLGVGHEAASASIREAYGRIVYSHKTHEKTVELLNHRVTRLKWANLVLMVLTFGGVLNAVFAGGAVPNLLTVLVSALALALAIYRMSFDPDKEVLEHRKTSNKLRHIRDQYADLIGDIKDGALLDEQIRQRRDGLRDRLDQVYADAPNTSSKAYKRAQKALGSEEEMTFSKGEVDRFLPPEIRDPPTDQS